MSRAGRLRAGRLRRGRRAARAAARAAARSAALAAALALCGAALAGCAGAGAGAAPAAPARAALPAGWGRFEPLLARAEALAAAGDGAALAAAFPALEQEGVGLLKAAMPHLLPRHEAARYLEARATFGQALVRLAEAREQGRTGELPTLVAPLADAWQGWRAVITGEPPLKRL
ncbi:MAG: hypothetical protein ACKOSS_02780 [Planctomycetia bacterium]